MEQANMYLAIMSDILDSGVWAQLSPSSKALYPVLCKFSNHLFKPVWPGTDILLQLTGFKTKKSLQEAKKELVSMGLLHVVPGTGRTPSHYYFRFDYKGSKVDIERYREKKTSPREVREYPSEVSENTLLGDRATPPNQVNIHIHKLTQTTNNNPNLSSLLNEFFGTATPRGDFREHLIQQMLAKYGSLEVGEAIRIAISKGKDGDIRYLEGILKNRDAKNPATPANTFSFDNLPESLKVWQGHLEPMGKFESTLFFSAKSNVSPTFVEEQFRKEGIQVKIVKPSGQMHEAASG